MCNYNLFVCSYIFSKRQVFVKVVSIIILMQTTFILYYFVYLLSNTSKCFFCITSLNKGTTMYISIHSQPYSNQRFPIRSMELRECGMTRRNIKPLVNVHPLYSSLQRTNTLIDNNLYCIVGITHHNNVIILNN